MTSNENNNILDTDVPNINTPLLKPKDVFKWLCLIHLILILMKILY